jgi:hypothetical protein
MFVLDNKFKKYCNLSKLRMQGIVRLTKIYENWQCFYLLLLFSQGDGSPTDEYVTANTAQTSDHTTTVDEFTTDYHSITTGTSQEPDVSY